jgi:hypothetical protein
MEQTILEGKVKSSKEQYGILLDNVSEAITDIFDGILEDHSICISNDEDDKRPDSLLLGLQGTMYEEVKEKVQENIEDFIDDLHEEKLIDGIIFLDDNGNPITE